MKRSKDASSYHGPNKHLKENVSSCKFKENNSKMHRYRYMYRNYTIFSDKSANLTFIRHNRVKQPKYLLSAALHVDE